MLDINQEIIEKELNEIIAGREYIKFNYFYRHLYLKDYEFEDESFPERLERLIERIHQAGKNVLYDGVRWFITESTTKSIPNGWIVTKKGVVVKNESLYQSLEKFSDLIDDDFNKWFEELKSIAIELFGLDCIDKECWRGYYEDDYEPLEALNEDLCN